MADTGPEHDPTAEFLDSVRAEPAPWRTERPPEQERPGEGTTGEEEANRPSRLRKAGNIAREAAPYLPLATYAGFLAADALDDDDSGQDFGFDSGS